jgi:hypothetical protein
VWYGDQAVTDDHRAAVADADADTVARGRRGRAEVGAVAPGAPGAAGEV